MKTRRMDKYEKKRYYMRMEAFGEDSARRTLFSEYKVGKKTKDGSKCPDDEKYIEEETEKYGSLTEVYEITPEHITGKTVKEA